MLESLSKEVPIKGQQWTREKRMATYCLTNIITIDTNDWSKSQCFYRRFIANTYQTPDDHLKKQYHLLERAQSAQIHSCQPSHGHGRHTTEETIDVSYVIFRVTGIHDARSNERNLCSTCLV